MSTRLKPIERLITFEVDKTEAQRTKQIKEFNEWYNGLPEDEKTHFRSETELYARHLGTSMLELVPKMKQHSEQPLSDEEHRQAVGIISYMEALKTSYQLKGQSIIDGFYKVRFDELAESNDETYEALSQILETVNKALKKVDEHKEGQEPENEPESEDKQAGA